MTKEVVVKKDESDARLHYERAKYRVHDTDDPALKEYYQQLIASYEKSHTKKCVNCACKKASENQR